MAEYSRKFGSSFPAQIMELHNFTDITTELYPIVQQYLAAYQQGNAERAALLLTQHPELRQCIITADTWNLFDEERYNMQIYATRAAQLIDVGTEEPASPIDQYVWIGGIV